MMKICQIFLVIFTVVALRYSGGHTDFQTSQKKTSERLKRQVDVNHADPTADPNSLIYKFHYRVNDEEGNMHYHGEQKNKPNVVRGCYGYTDIKGLYRIVEYIADEGGFRAKILSNEPGIHRQNPADVQMGVYTPLSGIGFSYVHPCVDTGMTTQGPENPSKLPETTEFPEPPEFPDLLERPEFPDLERPEFTEPPAFPKPTDIPEYLFGNTSWEDGRVSGGGFDKSAPPPEDKFEEVDQEVFEVPCFCAVGGQEVENAVEDGKELKEIRTLRTERGISVVKVDKSIGSRFDLDPSEIVLMGECNCRFVYRDTLDEGVDRSVLNLRKDRKKKK